MNILYQSDNTYAVYMGISICSLLENNQTVSDITIFIIDDGIDKVNKTKIQKMVRQYQRQVVFVSGNLILNDKEIADVFAYAGMRKNNHSYLKMFFDLLIPQVTGKIIYIDCDTAVTGDISELVHFDMRDRTIGMVMDSLVINSKESIGLNKAECYYNSGVILIDIDKWRERQCSKRIWSHTKNIRTYGTVDQDVLNIVLKKEIVTLPIRYNLQPIHLVYSYKLYSKIYRHVEKYYEQTEIEEAVKNPAIIHYLRYIGESPWNVDNVHPGTCYFDKYLQISPWADYKKVKSNRGIIFKIEKILYKVLPKNLFLRIFYFIHEKMIKKSNTVQKG